eukprot:403353961
MEDKSDQFKADVDQMPTKKQIYWDIIKVGVPAICGSISFGLVEAMNLIFMGQFNDPALVSGVGIGNVFISVFGIIILCGFNSALATLVSQSYGQKDMKLCGTYLNRGRVIILISYLPVLFIMLNAKNFFELTGVNQETSEQAQLYIYYMLPALAIQAQFDIMRIFMNSFGKTYASMYVQGTTTIIHYFSSYYFIIYLDMKLKGTAYSNTLTALLNLIGMLIIAYREQEIREAFFWPDKSSFQGLYDYMRFALPSMLMWALESWTFSIQTLMISTVSVEMAAAQSIIHNILLLYFMFTIGLIYASAALIGKFIGAGEVQKAKEYLKCLTYVGFGMGFLQCASLLWFGGEICQIFTELKSIVDIVKSVQVLLAFVVFFDCSQGWLCGVIRGLGIVNKALIGQIVVYYFICIPLQAYLLYNLKWGIHSIWSGMLIALMLIMFYYQYLIYFQSDWFKISKESQERQQKEKSRQQQSDVVTDDQLAKALLKEKLLIDNQENKKQISN